MELAFYGDFLGGKIEDFVCWYADGVIFVFLLWQDDQIFKCDKQYLTSLIFNEYFYL